MEYLLILTTVPWFIYVGSALLIGLAPKVGIPLVGGILFLLVFCLWKRPKKTLLALLAVYLFLTACAAYTAITNSCAYLAKSPEHLDYYATQIEPGMSFEEVKALIPTQFQKNGDLCRSFWQHHVSTVLNPEKPPVAFSWSCWEKHNGIHELTICFDENSIVIGYLNNYGNPYPEWSNKHIALPGLPSKEPEACTP